MIPFSLLVIVAFVIFFSHSGSKSFKRQKKTPSIPAPAMTVAEKKKLKAFWEGLKHFHFLGLSWKQTGVFALALIATALAFFYILEFFKNPDRGTYRIYEYLYVGRSAWTQRGWILLMGALLIFIPYRIAARVGGGQKEGAHGHKADVKSHDSHGGGGSLFSSLFRITTVIALFLIAITFIAYAAGGHATGDRHRPFVIARTYVAAGATSPTAYEVWRKSELELDPVTLAPLPGREKVIFEITWDKKYVDDDSAWSFKSYFTYTNPNGTKERRWSPFRYDPTRVAAGMLGGVWYQPEGVPGEQSGVWDGVWEASGVRFLGRVKSENGRLYAMEIWRE